MEMEDGIINKVAASGIVQLNLEDYYPRTEIVVFDLKPYLFMELVLKEKDFRDALLKHEWARYRDKVVALTCSADAIIPMWAYMLAATYLAPVARELIFGDEKEAFRQTFIQNIRDIRGEDFSGERVFIKGCGELPIPEFAYMEITKKLIPHVKSIMYGEPCSTVPVFKRK